MARTQDPVIHEEPCGTPDELEDSFLPLNQYGSCSEPKKNSKGDIVSVGCFNWDACRKSECTFKGKTAAQGGGPRNGVLRIVQKLTNGRMAARHIPVPCYHITEMREAHEGRATKENPVMVQMVAWEGTADRRDAEGKPVEGCVTFKLSGTKNVDENVPGEGLKRFAQATVHDWILKMFPRPKDNPVLAEEAFNAALMRDASDAEQDALSKEMGMPQKKAK